MSPWRASLAVIALAALLAPALAFSAGTYVAPRQSGVNVAPRQPGVAPTRGRYEADWLVVTAAGLRRSADGGRTWHSPDDLPPGSFYGITADPAAPGTAYVSNGDVFVTRDAGHTWSALLPPPRELGPAGVTTLAVDADDHTLLAGGVGVWAYRTAARARWQPWGRGWPGDASPRALLSVAGRGVFAAAGARLLFATDAAAMWRAVTTTLRGAPITTLALGPDGTTPYFAVSGRGVWYVDRTGAAHPLGVDGLPAHATISALQSDVAGRNLYAVTNAGLYWRHLNATYTVSDVGATWQPAQTDLQGLIAALRPLRDGLLAVGRGGALALGNHQHGQTLSWQPSRRRLPPGGTPVVAALSGAEWNAPPAPRAVPLQFTQDCVQAGQQSGVVYDVCGPFRQVYLQFRQLVLGYPREFAAVVAPGVVQQAFDNVVLQWRPSKGVYLLPLGAMAGRGRHFAKPSQQQVQSVLQQYDTAYVGGYYVEPELYSFWRQYQYNGASIFGPPISQFVTEPSTNGSGQRVQVQYFRNARLEYNPAYPPALRVRVSSLGQLYRSPHDG